MNIKKCLAVILLFVSYLAYAQTSLNTATNQQLQQYFNRSRNQQIVSDNPLRLLNTSVLTAERSLNIYLNEVLGEQPMTREDVRQMYRDIRQILPAPYNTYTLSIFCGTQPLEQLIQYDVNDTTDLSNRIWRNIDYKGHPWVKRTNLPYETKDGLQDRHLALWASHGRFYDQNENRWQWQRPRLFGTTEDLFTQSFVVPYLMPMLENAGAILYSPRERDWQKDSYILDNDNPQWSGLYREITGRNEWVTTGMGYGSTADVLLNGQNPFEGGTFAMTDVQTSHRMTSSIVWQPDFKKEGDYAVYVSYVSLPTSIPDATYIVRHSGTNTTVRVNQQMGGRTWVYLGTFHFQAGNPEDNQVKLTNQSNYRGVVTADAVRFGGGMGNIARGDSLYPAVRSMLPRYLEGARYSAQFAGAPYKYYANKDGTDDYAEDINVRSLMTNYMARGSVYLPGDSGLCVPLELSMGIHSDAGQRGDMSTIGTLGIYTTGRYTKGEYEGLLAEGFLPAGISRTTSRDLSNLVMSSVCSDIRSFFPSWTRRQMYDRNYSESRLPEVPSMILEMLSHQNYADMLLGHDPYFKFLVSRGIYKGILRYVRQMHNQSPPVIAPLPVHAFSALVTNSADSVHLSWQPTMDSLEPTAAPTHFVLYTAIGNGDWDNGTQVFGINLSLPSHRGALVRYRICAANSGGVSAPSEELCTYSPFAGTGTRMIIVNGFTRLAGPQPIDNDSLRGFRFDIDPGVVHYKSPCYSGRQIAFNKKSPSSLGESGKEYEHLLVAGNTFNYPTLHARDLLNTGHSLCISSSSIEAYEKNAPQAQVLDLILGVQRNDGYSLTSKQAFTTATIEALSRHAQNGGSILLSGAYLSEELATYESFSQNVLHMNPSGAVSIADSANIVQGMGANIQLWNDLNEHSFSTTRCSILQPAQGAFASTLYAGSGFPASVAWNNSRQRTLCYGFPLEMITDNQLRRAILAASLNFLIQ